MKTVKFMIRTLGCKANSSDGQSIEAQLRRQGWSPVSDEAEADIFIVNSCTVTDEADKQSQKAVTQFHRANPNAKIIYTGCGAEVSPTKALSIPGISAVIGNQDKTQFGNVLSGWLEKNEDAPVLLGGVQDYEEFRSRHPMDRDWPLVEARFDEELSTLERGHGTFRTRAFIKIQEGCNHFCTYCVIPYGRGPARSARKDEILKSVQSLLDQDIKEIILTGTNVGDHEDLETLIEQLLCEVKVPRLRVSSLDPVEITPKIISLMEKHENFCPHFHVSLQSPHAKILKLMKRKYTDKDVTQCLGAIAAIKRNPFVGMDIITGFPGETEEDFEMGVNVLAALPWTRLHVFPYSEREGTPATKLPGVVEKGERKRRARVLNELSLKRMMNVFQNKRATGDLVNDVLWESTVKFGAKNQPQFFLSGYTKDYMRVLAPVQDREFAKKHFNQIEASIQVSSWSLDRVSNEVHWIGSLN